MRKILDFLFGSPGTFLSKRAIGIREYYLSIPGNFNNKVLILMHGATGTADSIITGDYSSKFIVDLMDAGFGIILPSARPTFATGTPLHPRWETETQNNLDTAFISMLVRDVKKIVYGNLINRLFRPSIKTIIGGGSSGAIMATRVALVIPDKILGVLMLNGVSAQAVSLSDNGDIVFDTSRTLIPTNHPPVFMVTGLSDYVLPSKYQADYADKLKLAGINCVTCEVSDGNHFWDSWVVPFYPEIIAWLKRL